MNMISVGYGETERLLLFSRIGTFLWMVLGLIFLSFFTGSVVSALTTSNIESSVLPLRGVQWHEGRAELTASGIPT